MPQFSFYNLNVKATLCTWQTSDLVNITSETMTKVIRQRNLYIGIYYFNIVNREMPL